MIYHHLGLGDHLICNGLVRYLHASLEPAKIYLPVKKPYRMTVSRMYADLPKIVPLPVDTDEQVKKMPEARLSDRLIKVGFSKGRADFDKSFYDTNGIPFSVRWSHFKVSRDGEREKQLEESAGVQDGAPFVLVHNVGSVGSFDLAINSSLPRVYVSPATDCMLDWCSLAEKAEEVHCIDSSFIHLAQSLSVKRGVFHQVRPTRTRFVLHPSWETVSYQR